MSTEEAVKEYKDYLESIKQNHLDELPINTSLNANEQSKIIDKFFHDLDTMAVLKADELLNEFPSQADKTILSYRFTELFRECNEEFKNILRDWNSFSENNPTDGGFH